MTKKDKYELADNTLIHARDVIEMLFATGTWEFEDKEIRDIAYALNDFCIIFGKRRAECEKGESHEADA